jgi:TolB-like protein/Tfp pilus assembly protein PilF
VLASFPTISDAVYCAIEIQKACKEEPELKLRIGIHQGEVIMEDGDVFGDGVNIASRIEPLAPIGGIYVSESVFRNIENKEGIRVSFISEEALKNVKHPIRIYEVDVDGSVIFNAEVDTPTDTNIALRQLKKPALVVFLLLILIVSSYLVYQQSNKNTSESGTTSEEGLEKSIAVLPFANLSNDPEQEYFSIGMMEEILNHLFQIGDLQVTSRTSVMQYKGTTKTIPDIARELGVRTILEGSVRKSGNLVRITVQLIEGKTDKHLWSEIYERKMDDVFTIQSEVAKSIASTLKAEIHPEVKLRIESHPTDNFEAYNLYLESRNLGLSADENSKAIQYLEEAIKLDPDFSAAYSSLGFRLQTGALWGASEGGMDPQKARLFSRPYLLKAIELDPENGEAHTNLGNSYLWFDWDFERAEKEYKEVIRIYPQTSYPPFFLIAIGQFNKAYKIVRSRMKINPMDDSNWPRIIEASYFAGKYDDALNYIQQVLNDTKGNASSWAIVEACRIYMYLGYYEECVNTAKKARILMPDLIAPRLLASEAISYYHLANYKDATKIIKKLEDHSSYNAGGSPSFFLAMIYAQMGEIDTAFELLEKAYEDHEVEVYWLKVEPPFEPLHDDPRWQVMLDKVGFPD